MNQTKLTFNSIIGNNKVMMLLEYFMQISPKEISQSEIIEKTDITKTTAVKWLSKLVELDFLSLRKIGVTNLYALNNKNIIVKQLKTLKTLFILKPIKVQDSEIYLYGSSARGENDLFSDIDILIISQKKQNEIFQEIDKFSKRINKKINFVKYNQIEYGMLRKKDSAFYERIEKDKIKIK